MKKTICAIFVIALFYGTIVPASAVCDACMRKSTPVTFADSSCTTIAAIRTNLLYDALTIANFGLELSLGKRFSIGAELYFPWWRNAAKDITVQMPAFCAEFRYWLGDREVMPRMTGFFAGLQTGAGYYDFQLGQLTQGKGVQGSFLLAGALTAGYVQQISNSLRIEYSFGLGYLSSDYVQYNSVRNTAYGDIKVIPHPWEKHRISGLLPSKASVSLVWAFDKRQKK